MARFYANENFPLKVVLSLRKMGHDVLTSLESGLSNRSISDIEVLAFATKVNRCLLTINRKDFIRLHKENKQHLGIIVCTQDPDIQSQAERIHRAILEHEQLPGELIRVNRPSRL